jgi:hypothetical protein
MNYRDIKEVELSQETDFTHRSSYTQTPPQTEDEDTSASTFVKLLKLKKTQRVARTTFSGLFFLVLFHNSAVSYSRIDSRIVLTSNECIRDYSFIFTDPVN